MDMKKIVIPTDFSENAFNALKFAVKIFQHEECRFLILHAYADEVYNSGGVLTPEFMEEFKETTRKNSDKELESILLKIRDYSPNPGHRFEAISAFGILVDEINDLVNKEDADLAVMATRGKTNDRKLTFGSHTLQVIKYVQCPVLSIPEGYGVTTPKKILFPTNYMVPYQGRELQLAGDLAREFAAEIHMLYISKFPPENMRQKDNRKVITQEFHDLEVFHHLTNGADKTTVIQKFIDKLEIDLLILVNSRHSYLESILSQSTLDRIGLHPKVPFLVFQNFHRDSYSGSQEI